ncbi:MAG: hypothetical protein CMA18_007350, partial [Methanobacteriota archaeon]
MNSLDIRILGIVEYTDALEMMSELQRQRIEEEIPDTVPSVKNLNEEEVKTQLTFNDIDSVLNENDENEEIKAPKDVETLEEI